LLQFGAPIIGDGVAADKSAAAEVLWRRASEPHADRPPGVRTAEGTRWLLTQRQAGVAAVMTSDEDGITDECITAIIVPLYALSAGISRVVAGKPDVNRLAILQAIAHTEQIRPSQIAAGLNLHQSQVTRHLRALEDEELVELSVSADDRRSVIVTLTEAGRGEIHRLTAIGMAKWRRFLTGWDVADATQLGHLLSQLHSSIIAVTHDDRQRHTRRPRS
jgi:DNA-binding MarR family transcriptional regulator